MLQMNCAPYECIDAQVGGKSCLLGDKREDVRPSFYCTVKADRFSRNHESI